MLVQYYFDIMMLTSAPHSRRTESTWASRARARPRAMWAFCSLLLILPRGHPTIHPHTSTVVVVACRIVTLLQYHMLLSCTDMMLQYLWYDERASTRTSEYLLACMSHCAVRTAYSRTLMHDRLEVWGWGGGVSRRRNAFFWRRNAHLWCD